MTRIQCVVPGCKRTSPSADKFDEWPCSKHWPLVASYIKQEHRLVVRRLRKKPLSKHLQCLEVEAWQKCKEDAIEKAVGIR